MAYSFPNASVISYSRDSKFLGENFHYANTKNLTVQGFILDSDNVSGVKNIFQTMSGITFSGAEQGSPTETYQNVILNSVSVGSGRVVNISFDDGDNNTVRRTNYNVELEIFETGNADNFAGDYYPADVLTGDLKYLDNLSEDFSFDSNSQGGYSFTHNVSITFLDEQTGNAVANAQKIASGFFNNEPSFGLLDNRYSGYYFKLKNSGQKNFTESYDLVNFNFNFSKTFNLLSPDVFENSGAKYNLSTNHVIQIADNGKVTIQENGNIRALNGSVGNAVTGAKYEINNGAYNRSNEIYTSYKDTSGRFLFSDDYPDYDSLPTLFTKPTDKNFSVDVNSESAEYSVTFTNDPFYDESGSATTNYTSTVEESRVIVTEYTDYKFNFSTGLTEDALSLVKNKYSTLTGRNEDILTGLGVHFLRFAEDNGPINFASPSHTVISKDLRVNNQDSLGFDYTLVTESNKNSFHSQTRSKSPYLFAKSVNSEFNKFDIDFQDSIGQAVNSVYDINNTSRSQILQKLNIENISERTVTATVTLKRDFARKLNDSLFSYYLTKDKLQKIEEQVINKGIQFLSTHTDVVTEDFFITNIDYTFDNNYTLVYTMEFMAITQTT